MGAQTNGTNGGGWVFCVVLHRANKRAGQETGTTAVGSAPRPWHKGWVCPAPASGGSIQVRRRVAYRRVSSILALETGGPPHNDLCRKKRERLWDNP
mmetsp:Transcript_27616/g.57837  ORF Transcript_27616/g.57837 Transcript_27616/m.57837 type:complete len:97 (+) Transcript_27616:504-794(+)